MRARNSARTPGVIDLCPHTSLLFQIIFDDVECIFVYIFCTKLNTSDLLTYILMTYMYLIVCGRIVHSEIRTKSVTVEISQQNCILCSAVNQKLDGSMSHGQISA